MRSALSGVQAIDDGGQLLCLPQPLPVLLLLQHLHSSRCLRSEDGAAPAINPLQQAPVPAAGPGGIAAGGLDLGSSAAAAAADSAAAAAPLARAVARSLAISPQKLNDFAKVVRGLPISDALIQCNMSPKKSAKVVHKVLLSARANAVTNQGLEASRLCVGEPSGPPPPPLAAGMSACLKMSLGLRDRPRCRRLVASSQLFACPLHPLLACLTAWAYTPPHRRRARMLAPTPCLPATAEAWVGKGTHLKRVSMHGRGRSGRRLKYRCHLTVSE